MCLDGEKALRLCCAGKLAGPLSPEAREECLEEIGKVEGFDRRHSEASTDSELAREVLSAWTSYARDKGLMVLAVLLCIMPACTPAARMGNAARTAASTMAKAERDYAAGKISHAQFRAAVLDHRDKYGAYLAQHALESPPDQLRFHRELSRSLHTLTPCHATRPSQRHPGR